MLKQCSSCGGFCGGGFYDKKTAKYHFCKQLTLSQIKKGKK